MAPLSGRIDLGDGRVAAYEVIGSGPPLFCFQGGPGFSAALLRRGAELLADDFAVSYAALYMEATASCISVAARVVGEGLAGDEGAAEMEAFLRRHADQPWYPAARRTWDDWTERVLEAADPREVDAMMAEVLPLYTANPASPRVAAMIDEWRQDLHSDLVAIKNWESGLWQRIDVRPLLADIRCRTLVFFGALDPICGPTQGRLVAAALPDAELVIVPDCGHFIGGEAPAAFRSAIVRFGG